MKAREFSAHLRAIATMLGAFGASQARDNLSQLATVFDGTPTATVASVVKRLDTLANGRDGQGPTLGDVARVLAGAKPVVSAIAKPAILRDFQSVAQFVDKHSSAGLSDLAAAISQPVAPSSKARSSKTRSVQVDVVNRYLSLLEGARGDEARFWPVYNQLRDDPEVGTRELIELARVFSKYSVKSKADGLKRIANVQHEINTVRARAAATAGRSAA